MQFMVNNKEPSPEFSQLLSFAQKVALGHGHLLGGVPKREACLDLIVADVPDGLPIPNMEASVPTWNTLLEDWPESVFEVARDTLHDDGAIMLFHPNILDARQATDALAEAYGFTTLHDWWGVNDMLLTSYRNHTRTTKRFWIILYVKESHDDNPIILKFSIEVNRDLSNLGTDIVGEGALYNYTISNIALKNGDKMWRGACEKDPILVQPLIESFSKPGDVVLDCNASTGSSVHACRRSGRHLIALESDEEIFEAVLVPLSSAISTEGSIGEKRKEPSASKGIVKDRPTKRIAKIACVGRPLSESPKSIVFTMLH